MKNLGPFMAGLLMGGTAIFIAPHLMIGSAGPHLPTPPCPNCQCGCTVTGQCTCKDCDHPALVKPAEQPAKAKINVRVGW